MATVESSAWRATTTTTTTTDWPSSCNGHGKVFLAAIQAFGCINQTFICGTASTWAAPRRRSDSQLTTHMWSKQCAWWGRHLNAITQREIAGKLLRSSDGDRDETRIEQSQPCPLGAAPSPSPFAVRQPRRLQRFL